MSSAAVPTAGGGAEAAANTVDILDHWARQTPDSPAIIEPGGGQITFRELHGASARGAAILQSHGIETGDRVVLLIPISTPMYIALLAVLRIGAVATVFDPSAGLAHIHRCCERAAPKALIGARKAHALRLISPAIRRIPLKFHLGGRQWVPAARSFAPASGEVPNSAQPVPVAPVTPDAPALMSFTSGSTGQPKAAVRSHALLGAQGRAVAAAFRLGPGEIALTTLPVFTLANLAAGATTLIADADLARVGQIDPGPVLSQIERYRPQSVVASPAFLERLLQAPGSSLGPLRRIYTGGAPVFPDLQRRLHEAAPQAEGVAVYGSTEAEPVAHIAWGEMSPQDLTAMTSGAGLLAGHPVPEVTLRILPNTFGTPIAQLSEAEFAARCLGPDLPGEIVVTGDHVLKGYLDGIGDEATKFRVGGVGGTVWHRTGDVGRLDGHGRLWLLGRADAVVRDGRGELFPFTVEVAARGIPGIRRAALLPVNGSRLLVIEGDADPEAVKAHLPWAALDEVRRVHAIPLDRRHNAKVDYPALRKLLGTG